MLSSSSSSGGSRQALLRRGQLIFTHITTSRGLKTGEKVPIAFIKDAPVPTIKDDKAYPAWLFTLTEKLPSKSALVARAQKDGIKSLTRSEMMRTKRLITLEQIKENNLVASTKS